MVSWHVIPALKRRAKLKDRYSLNTPNEHTGLFPKHHSEKSASLSPHHSQRSLKTVLSRALCFSAGLLALILLSQTPTFAQTVTPTPNPTADPAKLPGTYSVVSVDPDGNAKQGSLKLSHDGKLQFHAELTFEDSKTEGIGLLREDVLAIVDGSVGCRAFLYKFEEADGTLSGVWSALGAKTPEQLTTEKGTPDQTKKATLPGKYNVASRAGETTVIYLGQLEIVEKPDYYQFYWLINQAPVIGAGLRIRNWIGVAATVSPTIPCNVTMLQINDDGTLEGNSIRTNQPVLNTVSAERVKAN